MIFFQIGVNMANAGLAAIVFSSNPIFVMIFSYFIIHEAFTRKKAITLVLSLIGLVIVANPMAIIRSGNIGLLVSLAAFLSAASFCFSSSCSTAIPLWPVLILIPCGPLFTVP